MAKKPATFGLDLEGAMLGGLLIEGQIPQSVSGLLTPDMFPECRHRRTIAQATLGVEKRIGSCDFVSVVEELQRNGVGIDATVEVARLAEAVPSTVHLVPHIVRKCLTLPETPHAWRAVPKSCGSWTEKCPEKARENIEQIMPLLWGFLGQMPDTMEKQCQKMKGLRPHQKKPQ